MSGAPGGNGYRERTLDTRLGALKLRIPKLRRSLPSRKRGGATPAVLRSPQQLGEALIAVFQEAWIGSVSTRRVDDLVKGGGLAGSVRPLEQTGQDVFKPVRLEADQFQLKIDELERLELVAEQIGVRALPRRKLIIAPRGRLDE